MKKIFILFLLIFCAKSLVFANNKDFWETKYTPSKIEYVQDKIFFINDYLKNHVPPNTSYFNCFISYDEFLKDYKLNCFLKVNNSYVTQKTLFPFYKLIEGLLPSIFDVNSANMSKEWSSKLPVILNVENDYDNSSFAIDKDTYKY